VFFTAFLRGEPIAPEWACSQEAWTWGDGSAAMRAEDPCSALERVYPHPHKYFSPGVYDAQLTLYSRRGHRLPSNVVTIHVGPEGR
jgi:hypothetical protein